MSIDIPRLQPVVTPTAAALDDELRVKRATRVEPLPSELAQPGVERRVVPERRSRAERRQGPLELRARRDRRAATRIDLNA